MLVSELLSYSLRIAGVLGVGQQPLAQDLDDALTTLWNMAMQWQRRRWLVYRLNELSCDVVSGQPTYSIGRDTTAGTPDILDDRPGSIEAAFIRQNIGSTTAPFLPVDFPLRRIDSAEEWSAIALKSLRSWPGSFFYDPTLPNGTFYLWPIPIQTFFTLHVFVPENIADGLVLTAEIEDFLPRETEEALTYNLAMRLRMMYQLPPQQELFSMARVSLQTLRATNLRLQKLGMPAAVMGRGGRWRNPMGGFYPETSVGVPYTVLP